MKKFLMLFFVLLVIPFVSAFTVTHTGSFTAGEILNISINMDDDNYMGSVFWNTTTDSALTWNIVNGDGILGDDNYTFNATSDGGVVNLSLSGNVAETFNLTVYNGTGTDNVTNITVNPADAVELLVEHGGEGVAGENVAINLLAKDQYGNVANYDGYALLTTTADDFNTVTWSEGSAWNGPGVWKYEFNGDGNGTIQLTNTKAESITITANNAFLDGDTSTALVISAAGMHHFAVTHSGYSTVGDSETITVTAQDEYNNTVLDYIGDYTITTTATSADNLTWNPTAPYVFTGTESGVDTITVISSVAQFFTINATDINGITGTSETLTFDNPEISVSSNSGDIGAEITVTGTGFSPGSNVDVKLDGTIVNSTTTDANGVLSITFVVPPIANGTYNITAGTANVEFTVNPTYVGFEATEPSKALIVNPIAGSTGTTTFVVSASGNMLVNVTSITATDLTNDGEYSISNVSFSPSAFELEWDGSQEVDVIITLEGEPVEGTYEGEIVVVDNAGNTVELPLSVELTTGVYGLAVADTLSISGNDEDTTKTATLTLTNNGTLDLSGIALIYASSDSSNGKVSFSATDALVAGASQSVTVTANITDLSVGTYSGTITVSTNEGISDTVAVTITVTEAPLELLVIDEVDSNEENNLGSGDELNSISPGKTLTLDVTVKNKDDLDMEDVVVTVTIIDIDDGDDLEAEYDIGDINDGDTEEASFSFDIPWELDSASYDLDIEVEGEDEDGEEYTDEWTIILDVEKATHDVAVSDADLGLSILKCVRSTSLMIDITNTGERDENDVVLSVESSELGISFLKKDINLDEPETYSETIPISLSDSFAAGTYGITIKTYYDEDEYDDNDMTDYNVVNLVVEDCVTITPTTPTTPTTPPAPTPTGAVTSDIPTSSEGFSDSIGYAVTLALVNLVLLVIIIFVLVKIFTPKPRP